MVANVMTCDLVVSKFELQLRSYFNIKSNTFGETMSPLIFPAVI